MAPDTAKASALAALVLVAALACSSSSIDSDLWSYYRDQLTAGRALWSQNAGAAYTIRFEEYCSCGTAVGPVLVDVDAGGTITAVTDATSGEAVPQAEWSETWTVDRLFDRLGEAINQRVASYEAHYDATYGYPSRAAIDYDHAVSGDEVSFRITSLTWPGG